jgi:hypothetical protein
MAWSQLEGLGVSPCGRCVVEADAEPRIAIARVGRVSEWFGRMILLLRLFRPGDVIAF